MKCANLGEIEKFFILHQFSGHHTQFVNKAIDLKQNETVALFTFDFVCVGS
jgi:hypothetical protein